VAALGPCVWLTLAERSVRRARLTEAAAAGAPLEPLEPPLAEVSL
jgi:uncharacterized membrane protein